MTEKNEETFTFGYQELKALIAISFGNGITLTNTKDCAISEILEGLNEEVEKMIQLKRDYDKKNP